MSKKLFTLEEARTFTIDALRWFEEVRNGKAGDWATFDDHDMDGYRQIIKYTDELKLSFHGCIMDHHGYRLTEETDTSLLPDVSEILKEKREERKAWEKEHLIGMSTEDALDELSRRYNEKHMSVV